MNEKWIEILERDVPRNDMIADARKGKLLERIGMQIPAEETILHIGLRSEAENNFVALLCVSSMPLVIVCLILLLIPYTRVAGFILLGITFAWILVASGLRGLTQKYTTFTIVVFTDTAIYEAPMLPRAIIAPIISRIEYRDIKAITFKLNPFFYRSCKVSAVIHTEYNARLLAFSTTRFAASSGIFKQIMESIVRVRSPVAAQRERYAHRAGVAGATNQPGDHLVPQDVVDHLHARRARYDRLIPLFTISVGILLVLAISAPWLFGGMNSPPVSIACGVAAYIVGAFLVGTVFTRRAIPGFHVKGGTRIEVRDDGIAFSTESGPGFIAFSESFVAGPVSETGRLSYVNISSIAPGKYATKLGPVIDFWGLYYDIRQKYEQWLETRTYFIDMETLAEASLDRNEYMSTLATQLRCGRPSTEQKEVLIEKKVQLDMLDQLKQVPLPAPRSLRELEPELRVPAVSILDRTTEGEMFYLLLHAVPLRGAIGKKDIIVTNEQLLVADPKLGSISRVPFSRIKLAQVELLGTSGRMNIVLHLMPKVLRTVPVARISIYESSESYYVVIGLKKVPCDTPLVALLADVGKVPIILK